MEALDLLSGDAHGFLTGPWASYAHVHKADAVVLRQLLSLDDVDTLLTSTALRAPALRVAQDGAVLPSRRFTRHATISGESLTGLIDARKVVDLFDGGATLVLQGLHRYWQPLTLLVRDLERSLGHPCQANAYLTPRGSQGFALHEDSHDVFVFQTFGTKQWEIHDRGNPTDVLMEPGTSMYQPTGTPHAARAQETASLHVTIGINQTSYRDALKRVVADLLETPAYADRLGTSARMVFDVVYDPPMTPLLRAAAVAGARVVPGLDLLLYQAARQVVLMTGVDEAPIDAMRHALAHPL